MNSRVIVVSQREFVDKEDLVNEDMPVVGGQSEQFNLDPDVEVLVMFYRLKSVLHGPFYPLCVSIVFERVENC